MELKIGVKREVGHDPRVKELLSSRARARKTWAAHLRVIVTYHVLGV